MTRLSPRIADLALSDAGFVFDPQTGDVFTVNSTGLSILQCLKEGHAGIEDWLRERYDVGDGDVARDVSEFLEILAGHGLVSHGEEDE